MLETSLKTALKTVQRIARAPYRIWGIALAGLLMTALLGQIVMERISILSSGTEIRLATAPVDPRDIFRGDYVILTYEISTIRLDQLSTTPKTFQDGDVVYVHLAPQDTDSPNSMWEAVSISHEQPASPDASGKALVTIKGRINWINEQWRPPVPVEESNEDTAPCPTCRTASIDYGIEQYFVPEGEGRALEDMRNEGAVTILAAVAKNGNAAIKGIILNGGEPAYLEPLL